MAYCTQSDIELFFGTENVTRWSSTDPNVVAPSTARVAAAVAWADDQINSRLRRGRYAVPLSPVDACVTDWSVKLAGLYLHAHRMTDSTADPSAAKFEEWRNDVYADLRSASVGVLRLTAGFSGTHATAPFVAGG